jgi:hypothetical protein
VTDPVPLTAVPANWKAGAGAAAWTAELAARKVGTGWVAELALRKAIWACAGASDATPVAISTIAQPAASSHARRPLRVLVPSRREQACRLRTAIALRDAVLGGISSIYVVQTNHIRQKFSR